jgi:hypothetical protein
LPRVAHLRVLITNTIRNVTIVVRALMTSCQAAVAEQGPVSAHDNNRHREREHRRPTQKCATEFEKREYWKVLVVWHVLSRENVAHRSRVPTGRSTAASSARNRHRPSVERLPAHPDVTGSASVSRSARATSPAR